MVKTISSPINDDIMSTLDKFIEKGEQIGIQKEKIDTVLKAYDNGIAIPLIANISSLTEEEVIKILKEKGKSK